ncbi:MAG: conjugal transfer protein TraX [Treponema sp.]|nr:conjugal transfer protein TraX [Treponema sp.]
MNNTYDSLTANKLKIIAAFFMLLDHFVSVFLPHHALMSLIFRMLGRTAAPVFCFFIAQGYHYTSNRKKYLIRLLVLALVSHLPYVLAFGLPVHASSVVWPLALGLIALMTAKSEKIHLILKLLIIGALCVMAYTSNWYFIAILWILGFGLFHGNIKKQLASFSLVALIHIAWQLRRFGLFHEVYPQWFQLGLFLTLPLLLLYNGQLGKKSAFMSWFFYVFYPGHLVLLYLLKIFTPLAEFLGH